MADIQKAKEVMRRKYGIKTYEDLIEAIRNTPPLDISIFVCPPDGQELPEDYEMPCPIFLTKKALEIYQTDPHKAKRKWRKNYPYAYWL